MELFYSLDYISPTPTVVALGCFDGVHLGHVDVIRHAKEQARRLGAPCTVWTFEEPPKNYFAPRSVPLITPLGDKQARIGALGVDALVCVPFDETVKSMTAEDFFQTVLCQRLHACHLTCGYNYSFGAKGLGNPALLRSLCEASGVGLTVVPPVSVGDTPVSSSAIRLAMTEGAPEQAAAMLGRPYSLTAPVVHGQHLARRLGFPTVNQIFPEGQLIPKAGVYATRVRLPDSDGTYMGISNVGVRPTVSDHTLCCETHVFDYSGDLYGTPLTVEFLSFLRPEQRFASVDAMSQQVMQDMAAVQEFFRK